jgi:undecaprenyl-diphosphatase
VDGLHILILALVQALTEFLPVSSSAHLVLASYFLGWDYQGIAFDLALHLGTLLAVLVYFRTDLWAIVRALLRWRPGQPLDGLQRLGIGLGLSTIPAVIVGASMGDAGALLLRHPLLIAANLIVFGLLLGWADRRQRRRATTETDQQFDDDANAVFADMSLRQAILIGCAQALALVPGTSRSGVTLTAGLLLGLSRAAAARYSFLMSVPVMILALVHALWGLLREPDADIAWGDFAVGAGISFLAGLVVIHIFLGIIRRAGLTPFVLYRLLLGAAVIVAWFLLR